MAGWGWTLDRGTETQRSVGEQTAARFAAVSDVQPAAVAALKFHDINCEVRFVLGEVKKLLRSGVPADDIAIVARDLDPYAKEFAAVGGEYGVPTRSSLKIPLAETLLGGLVGLILSAVEKDFAFEQTARLLGHPLGPGMSDETWRRSRRSRVEYYHEWCELEESLKCLDDVRGKTAKPAAEWVKCLRAIFAHFNVRSSAGWIARETVAYNCFQDELSLLADEPEMITFAEFSVAVRDVLSVVKTSFDPSRGGVLITEPHVVPGGRFRHVYVLGMAEGLLPALPADNPVIDFHERSRLAAQGIDFEAASDITRWEDLSFFSLISTAAASLTLTYPETVGKEEMLASSYFDKLGLKPENGSAAVLASAAEQLRNILRKHPIETAPMYRPAFRRFEIERRRESAQAHDEFDGVIGEAIDVTGREWSVSQLKTLAGCGFSWFAKYGLRLAPADEMDPEVSASARGSLLHFALDYPVSAGNAKTREDIVGLLDHSLAVGFHDRDVRMPRVRNWDMLRTQYVAELTKAVMAPDFLPEGATIAATEQEFQIGLHGLGVRGRIDRVDRTDQGMTAVDYKTSSRKPDPVKDRDGRKLDLQIAVYLAALRQLYPQMPAIGGAYYSLSARKRFSSDAVDDDVLRAFLAGVTGTPGTGSLPVRPISPDACTFCDYDPLCRKSSRLARKEAVAE
jgi:RecB family exonuclease